MPILIKDLAFNARQCLDLYLVGQPGRPLVTCIHGGGFISGSKDDARCQQSASFLNEAGFNVASLSYALAPPTDRFAMWPRNLFDVADALVYLHKQRSVHGYDFNRLGMLGFSAGCCLSNLYIQGGEELFQHLDYKTPVFRPLALAGFYGPYDFSRRRPERRSKNEEINRDHSPRYWLQRTSRAQAPPVLHVQGDLDEIVYLSQHQAFQKDYQERGFSFQAIIAEGFGHSFAPRDTNGSGKMLDVGPEIARFFTRCL